MKNEYKLTHHEAFKFVGDKGTYEIPPVDKLEYDTWSGIAMMFDGRKTDVKKMLDNYKAFFLNVCPDLAAEDIGDNQWLQFGNAYFKAMGEQ